MAEEITQLLIRWSRGDQEALGQLMPLVYDEMRRLARGYLNRQGGSPILQPTVLVHEAYLRLINQKDVEWQGRAQFFGLAAKIMRELLIDHLRHQQAIRHGGGAEQVSLSHAEPMGQLTSFDLLALDEALDRLAALDPQHSRIVELRFFGGLTIEETAEALGVSSATVERNWNLARAWLHRELGNR
jgi:RNA polymerase sigma factor (TIGR02999 family)